MSDEYPCFSLIGFCVHQQKIKSPNDCSYFQSDGSGSYSNLWQGTHSPAFPAVLVLNHQTFLEARASVAANALPFKCFKVCAQVEFICHLTHISFRKQSLHSKVSMLCLYSWAAKYTFLFLNLMDKTFASEKLLSTTSIFSFLDAKPRWDAKQTIFLFGQSIQMW